MSTPRSVPKVLFQRPAPIQPKRAAKSRLSGRCVGTYLNTLVLAVLAGVSVLMWNASAAAPPPAPRAATIPAVLAKDSPEHSRTDPVNPDIALSILVARQSAIEARLSVIESAATDLALIKWQVEQALGFVKALGLGFVSLFGTLVATYVQSRRNGRKIDAVAAEERSKGD